MSMTLEEENKVAREAGDAYPSDGAMVQCINCGREHRRRPGWAHLEYPSCYQCDTKWVKTIEQWYEEIRKLGDKK